MVKRLLSDEVETSAVSGKVADSALIAHSDRSRAPALPGELVRCEESGAMLLPSETGECQETGMRVDTALLGVSDYSKKTVRRALLHVCPETHRTGLEAEMGRCAVSGQILDKRQLVECTASGQLVRRSLTTVSAVSGRVLLRDRAITAQSGRVGHPDEIEKCAWTGWALLPDETKRCKLTSVSLSKSQVDPSGVSLAHADLIHNLESILPVDGQVASDAKEILEAAGHKASRIWARRSPTTSAVAVVAECRSLFGLRRRYAVCFLDAKSLLGRSALVDVRDGKWALP